jgi:hypothetical protein
MKIKAKDTYLELTNEKNFISLNSASTHLKLKAGEVVEWNGKIPKSLMAHLTEVKKGSNNG